MVQSLSVTFSKLARLVLIDRQFDTLLVTQVEWLEVKKVID